MRMTNFFHLRIKRVTTKNKVKTMLALVIVIIERNRTKMNHLKLLASTKKISFFLFKEIIYYHWKLVSNNKKNDFTVRAFFFHRVECDRVYRLWTRYWFQKKHANWPLNNIIARKMCFYCFLRPRNVCARNERGAFIFFAKNSFHCCHGLNLRWHLLLDGRDTKHS